MIISANSSAFYRSDSDRRADAFVKLDVEDFDDLIWPVTTGDCVILIFISIAVLIGIGTMAAWVLGNIISIS